MRCIGRAVLTSLLLAPALLLVSACSGPDSSPSLSSATPSADGQPVTITWSFWGDDWEVIANQRILRAFEREHPQIKVQIEHRPWGQYFTWLRAEWAAGRSPDVMFLNYIPSYADTGELAPIDELVAADAAQLADFYPALLDTFRFDGHLYGLPRDNDTKVVYYNRAHFQEAGLPEPSAGWTWDDLREAALALTRHSGPEARYGFGFEPDYWWLVWLWQNGGAVVDDPYRPNVALLNSPANIEALQFLQDLIYVDGVTPPAAQLNTDAMNALFREGRLSMMFGNHTLIPWFANEPDLSWDVAPLPGNRVRANVAGGAGFVMSSRSPHREAAWELIRFLTGAKAQALLAESGVITPARRSVREDNVFLRQEPYRADVFLAETELGRAVPNFPGVTEMERVIGEGLAPLWRGERSAAEVLRDLQPQVDRIVAAAADS
jgi:multiple sugar transport system substrate-binding protein